MTQVSDPVGRLDVDWLRDVPRGWGVKPLRAFCKSSSLRGRPNLPLLSVERERGVILRVIGDRSANHNVVPDDLSNYKVVSAGGLAVNKMKAWQGSLGVAPQDGVVSPAYYVFKVNGIDPAYLHILLRSRPYVSLMSRISDGVRIGQWDLRMQDFKNLLVVAPPLSVQAEIVARVKEFGTRTSLSIAAKRKLIKLLEEQKQVIITQAVTKGLDPNAEMKDSGVDWLGEVPSSWNVGPIREFCRPVSLRGRPELTLLSVERERGVIPRVIGDRSVNHNVVPDDLSNYKVVRKGDLVVNKMKGWQGSLGVAPQDGIVSPAYFVFRVSGIRAEFLNFQLRSKYGISQLARISDGVRVGQWDLRMQDFKNLYIAQPSENEQNNIVLEIQARCSEIDGTAAKIKREIELLNEYRTTLISEVVTGKRSVDSIPSFGDVLEMISDLDDFDAEVFNEELEEVDS